MASRVSTRDKLKAASAWIRDNSLPIFAALKDRIYRDGLRHYRALPAALPFHQNDSQLRILVGSNQSGKTTAAVAEVSRIVMGRHPLYPKRDGIMLCVGIDNDHIGQNMWKELAGEGSYECILDEATRLPRAVRTNPLNPKEVDPADMARKQEWFPSPPILPYREWDWTSGAHRGVVWEDKGANVPHVVNIKSTGWKMLFHPGGGNPRRGIKVHAAWWDEEIPRQWFFETIPRLVRWRGRLIWSATPQTANEELMQLIQQARDGSDLVHATWLYLEDNPFIPPEGKKLLYDTFAAMSDEDLQVRYYGKPALLGRLVYPMFDMALMGADGFN